MVKAFQKSDIKQTQEITEKIKKELNQIKLETFKVTLEQIQQYIAESRKNNNGSPPSSMSLNDYLIALPENKGKLIIADLTDLKFNGDINKTTKQFNQIGKNLLIDLRGADFSGAILKNNEFDEVDLTDAAFRDTDLSNTSFKDSKLTNVDFRGADLISTEFDKNYKTLTGTGKNYVEGIKFSTSPQLVRRYANIKAEALKQQEEQITKAAIAPAIASEEIKSRESKIIMNESLINVFGSSSVVADPMYIKGSKAEERDKPKVLVRLNEAQVKSFLSAARLDGTKNSLNKFAEELALAKGEKYAENTIFIADFSAKYDNQNKLLAGTDLANEDFSGIDLSRVNFAGANLEGCKFNGAILNHTNLESANLKGALFNDVQARDANFLNTELEEAKISNSDFKRAFMPRSNGEGAEINNSNFEYADIRYGEWDGAKLGDVKLNFANLEGISLANANLRVVEMQHAVLSNAILNEIKAIEVDLRDSLMEQVKAVNIELTKCNLENAEAEGIELKFAVVKDTILKNAKLRFAKLDSAVLDNVKAQNIDLTGSELNNLISAKKADFTGAILKDIKAEQANFQEALMKKADLRGANLKEAILKKVELDEADLTNVNLTSADLEAAHGKNIKVNAATRMNQKTNIENTADLSFIKITANNKEVEISPFALKEEQLQADIAEENQGFRRKIGDILKNTGKTLKKTANFISKPFGKKTGVILGIVVGAVVATGIAAAIVATGGAALMAVGGIALTAAVVGGCVLGGMAIGGLCGGIIAKKGGICGIASAVVGTLVAGPIGTAVGVAAYFGVNKLVKKFTGYDLDGLLGGAVGKAGEAASAAGNFVDPATEQGKATAKERADLEQQYIPERKEEQQPEQKKAKVKICENQRIAELAKEQEYTKQNTQKESKQQESKIIDKVRENTKHLINKAESTVTDSLSKFKVKTGMNKGI